MTPDELKQAMYGNVFGPYSAPAAPQGGVAQGVAPTPIPSQTVADPAVTPQPEGEQPTMQDLWTQKYGNGSVNGDPNVAGVKNEFGHEVFALPKNMPITIDDSFDGPRYNEDIGEVLGFDPNGQIMTTKTHPYLRGLVRGRGVPGMSSGAGGQNSDGGLGGEGFGGEE